MTSGEILLEANDFNVRLHTPTATVRAVRGVDLEVRRSETLAVVGESGCGKTVMTLAMFGLLPPGTAVETSGEVRFDGRSIVRGERPSVGIIFQDPGSALNPMRRIGSQLVDAIRASSNAKRHVAARRGAELLDLVGLPEPGRQMKRYPHELSGGMRQRATIAIALAGDPSLLIADEPTTALDPTVQAQVLELLARLREELGTAIVLITHDIGVVAGLADRVAVMYAGRIVEQGTTMAVLTEPQHPYTVGLLGSLLEGRPADGRFRALEGAPPDLSSPIRGCGFAARCVHALDSCRTASPELLPVTVAGSHLAACPVLHDRDADRGMELR